jgi:AmmeMemoRadiSam system protein A
MELLDHAFEGGGEVTGVTTSGHVSGSFDLSVTYASVVYRGSWRRWSDPAPAPVAGTLDEHQRRRLLALARATLRSHIGHDESLAQWFAAGPKDDALRSLTGAFVTVHNTGKRAKEHGRLRACMGVIEARQPLLEAVISAAVSAAHDPRFPRLEVHELDRVELEVSILSPARRVDSAEQIVVGTHGVVLSKARRRAVYLPQVAPEQGWDREEMLEHLSAKAGLPGDAWRRGAELEVFTAQVFGEGS